MKGIFILIQLFLFLGLDFSPAICGTGKDEDQSNSVCSTQKTGNATYMISRYVIGSGGVTNATSPNHFHSATAGEAVVAGMQSANNWLLSGFWLSEGYGPSGVEQEEAGDLPMAFELHQNYPNPFNPQTTIQYDLPKECVVIVDILNVVGQRICLVSSQLQGPGYAQVFWDGRDEQGKLMGSGVYFYRITASATKNKAEILFQQIKKMLLVK